MRKRKQLTAATIVKSRSRFIFGAVKGIAVVPNKKRVQAKYDSRSDRT